MTCIKCETECTPFTCTGVRRLSQALADMIADKLESFEDEKNRMNEKVLDDMLTMIEEKMDCDMIVKSGTQVIDIPLKPCLSYDEDIEDLLDEWEHDQLVQFCHYTNISIGFLKTCDESIRVEIRLRR